MALLNKKTESTLLEVNGIETPELNQKNQKDSQVYLDTLNAIRADVRELKQRKEQAREKVEQYKKELNKTGVDVVTATDDSKRKEYINNRKKLKELLEEEEMYLYMDIPSFVAKRLEMDNIGELKQKAQQEHSALARTVSDYQAALRKEAEDCIYKAAGIVNSHSFKSAENILRALENERTARG